VKLDWNVTVSEFCSEGTGVGAFKAVGLAVGRTVGILVGIVVDSNVGR
jgi:tetrahydromethanopterin S-methyltransferase subunit G